MTDDLVVARSALDSLHVPRARWTLLALAAGVVLAGVVVAVLGQAAGALLIAAGLGIAGAVDRRFPVLAAVVMLPTLTIFHPLVLTEIGGSALDFRLLLTGGTGLALGVWLLVDPRRPDVVGWLLIAFVALLAVLSLANDASPLHALPVLGRWGTFAVTYLAARRWLGDAHGTWLLIGALVIGMLPPAVSGFIQLVLGTALQQNEAARLSGVYATSPVGLGLAMMLAALALASVLSVWRGPNGRWHRVAIVLFVAFTVILVGTATRLVFAASVVGLLMTVVLARRYLAIPAVLIGAVLVLVLQPGLAGRLASTVEPLPTIPPILEPGQSPPPELPDEQVIGDSSLRFRLYVWGSMLPEWTDSPLIGQGTGSFATLFERRSGLERVAPHNDYLGIVVETGLLGLGLFLATQAAVVILLLRRIVRRHPERARLDDLVTLVCFVSLNIVNSINNPMLFLDLQVIIWALVGSTLARPAGEPVREREADAALATASAAAR